MAAKLGRARQAQRDRPPAGIFEVHSRGDRLAGFAVDHFDGQLAVAALRSRTLFANRRPNTRSRSVRASRGASASGKLFTESSCSASPIQFTTPSI